MKIEKNAKIPDVLLLTPAAHHDDRGYFFEAHRSSDLELNFVQSNVSKSAAGVLRGLHFQSKDAQGKLVRVLSGAVFDVAVDLRRESQTCGQWTGQLIDDVMHQAFYVPPGFAHGFLALRPSIVHYECTTYYDETCNHVLAWNDPDVGVIWPVGQLEDKRVLFSPKDMRDGRSIREVLNRGYF